MTTLTAGQVRVVHGATDDTFDDIAGEPVAAVRAALAAFNVPSGAVAFVNGLPVTPDHRLEPGDTIEFVHPFGVKGALDPDELALLQRIEAKLDQLLPVSANLPGPAATSCGRGGRRIETEEIAVLIGDLRAGGRTWKEVLAACRRRWPNDRRVRTTEQLRKTWQRHIQRRRSAD